MPGNKQGKVKTAKLGGCIVASVTPMKKSGAIDYPLYRKLVEWFIDQGVDGICAAGTTGESPTLEPSEHSEFIAKTVRFVDGRVPVVAGTGANSTAEAVSLTATACADGADYCLSVVPYYNRPPQEGLRRHFEEIAERSSRPIILYNVPGRTVADLADETVGELARHPRIAGIKDATGNIFRAVKIREFTDENFILLSGDDSTS
ncbi:MAG: 4-hydroxy-tetrahydrodipicolinate synthase, partial [Betaproteobacteria bacterium]|nr:4-hydroxy-tetrahydrodipicolinate synthase [Betaproteobacteria bacterium]